MLLIALTGVNGKIKRPVALLDVTGRSDTITPKPNKPTKPKKKVKNHEIS